jgi:hypothetical protein
MMKLGHRLMNYMEDMEKPIIAAVNGFAWEGDASWHWLVIFGLHRKKPSLASRR